MMQKKSEYSFSEKVIEVVLTIPYGKVVTYGQIATCLGNPRASRAVGWTLSRLYGEELVPWYRVVNRNGELSIINPFVSAKIQAELLKKEGVVVKIKNENYKLDLKRYQHLFLDKEKPPTNTIDKK